MTLLTGFKVVQIGGGSAAAVCGRLLADVGAQVFCIDPGDATGLLACLNRGKAVAATATERREALAAALQQQYKVKVIVEQADLSDVAAVHGLHASLRERAIAAWSISAV